MARKKNKEEWKTFGNVFDQFTLRQLHYLENQGYYEELTQTIQVGKEANVFLGKNENEENVAVKIYRLENCNFNKMQQYIASDPRFPSIRPQKRDIIFAWVQREYRNLLVSRQAGVRVPTPIINRQNVLLEEFIGEGNVPALQLKDVVFEEKEEVEDCFNEIIKQMKILWEKAKLVHGDLSEFNILYHENKPVFIDFSQATSVNDYHAREYLERDLKNVCRFFRKFGMKVEESDFLKEFPEIKVKDEEFYVE